MNTAGNEFDALQKRRIEEYIGQKERNRHDPEQRIFHRKAFRRKWKEEAKHQNHRKRPDASEKTNPIKQKRN